MKSTFLSLTFSSQIMWRIIVLLSVDTSEYRERLSHKNRRAPFIPSSSKALELVRRISPSQHHPDLHCPDFIKVEGQYC